MEELKSSKSMPVISLLRRIEQKQLKLRPDYQRDSVWTNYQKRLLIDSILRGLDIPKIYIHEKNEGPNEVVDGQQRLTTLFEYYKDKFRLEADADPVGTFVIKGKKFSELHSDLQDVFTEATLDIVFLRPGFGEDQIEDMFLRLQQGTPLNAAEKRRALPGNMRHVVAELSKDKFFKLCHIKDTRYAHQDAVAKLLHQRLAAAITDIRPMSIAKTYEENQEITADDPRVKSIKSAFSFLRKAFPGPYSPNFKKYSIITVGYLVCEMLEQYNLRDYPSEFGEAYQEFERLRAENDEKDDKQQSPEWKEYSNAARADGISQMEYRCAFLERFILSQIPKLQAKDSRRAYTVNEKQLLYRLAKGVCASCKKVFAFDQMEADHKKEHSRGGATSIENGQMLCIDCHADKTRRMSR